MDLLARSLDLMVASQASSGAFVAAPTFRPYRYAWIRDGSFVAAAFDAVGEHRRARAFHEWAARTVVRYRAKVDRLTSGVPARLTGRDALHPRFTPDGREAEEPWSNVQLDCYGLWLSELTRHLQRTGSDIEPFREAASLVARYLGLVWDRPSADCWEEFDERHHPMSVLAVAGGLMRAAEIVGDGPAAAAERALDRVRRLGLTGGALAKFDDSPVVDGGSLLVADDLRRLDPSGGVVSATLDRVEGELVAEAGGVHRYLDDRYYGGGLWLPLAGALALARERAGDRDGAREALDWMAAQASQEGALPEQVLRHLRHPDERRTWERRWGPVADPLVWSHAMFVLARVALG